MKEFKKKTCDVCFNEFADGTNAKRCSSKCRKEHDKLRTRARPSRQHKWREVVCPECDVWFSTWVKAQIICGSNECKYKRAYRKRSLEYIEKERIRCREYHARTIGAERARKRELEKPRRLALNRARKLEQSRRRYSLLKEQRCGCVKQSVLDAYDKGMCQYCDGKRKAVEWDHIVPIQIGGEHCYNNLAPICRSCNRGWKRISWNKVLSMNIIKPFECKKLITNAKGKHKVSLTETAQQRTQAKELMP